MISSDSSDDYFKTGETKALLKKTDKNFFKKRSSAYGRMSFGKDSSNLSNEEPKTTKSKYEPPKALNKGKFLSQNRTDSQFLQREAKKVQNNLKTVNHNMQDSMPASEDYTSVNDVPNLIL